MRKFAQTAKNTAFMPARVTNGAAEKIKSLAKAVKIQEIQSMTNPQETAKIIGEKGVVGVLKIADMTGRFILNLLSRLFRILMSVVGPYLVIAALVLLVILLPVTGFLTGGISSVAGEMQSSDSETGSLVTSSVAEPRISGTSTELTYKEVYNSPWYSHYYGSPFAGDYGLDKMRGDRGGNCVAYAWGRRCELEGEKTQLGTMGDACKWFAREVKAGIYKTGQTAEVGAVACWSYGSEKYGHVAIIEKINDDGSIVTSNSKYGSYDNIPKLFYNATYTSEETLKSAYAHFQGYIYLEKVEQ
jgi:surface antigen